MFRRMRPLRDPVDVTLDGTDIPAERGEPLAAALLAADKFILARSPKLHRPRSAGCFRGGCDGCLMRVDGAPNVMTCLRPARGGERIEAQNVMGSRQADLLRATDWFFPKGIDHHHLMAGVPGLGTLMQSFARKIAGLGRLPAEVEPPRTARRLDVDAVVVGGGLAGLTVARRLLSGGVRVALVDDGLALGGSLLGLPEAAEAARAGLDGVTLFSGATAAGVYHAGELLIADENEAVVVRARAKVFATGAHDGMLPFAGNDMPGVFSARALCRLHAYGIVPEGLLVLVGGGFWADELGRLLGDQVVRVAPAALVGVEGTAQVKRVLVRDESGERALKAEVLALAVKGAPAFEVASQAGAEVHIDPERGYAVTVDERGRAGEGLWAVGECTGCDFEPAAIEAAAARVAEDVRVSLR